MRTTINLDDSTYEIAFAYAQARGISLGKAIGELIEQSQKPRSRSRVKIVDGLPVLKFEGGNRVSSDLVRTLEREEGE